VVAVAVSGDLVTGLVLGILLGLLLGRLLRSWLGWHEWVSASREADLMGNVLERMDVDRWPVHEIPESKQDPEAHSDQSMRRDAS